MSRYVAPLHERFWAKVPREDAPAVALAVLEEAGYTGDGINVGVSDAIRELRGWIEEKAKEKAEAEEAEKLDEEAKALHGGVPHLDTWADLSEYGRNWWRDIARAAREIHGAKTP